MKQSKLGFTLVEMLVVLAIMGVILVIVFPSVTQLLRRNEDKEYTYYEQTLLEAAKLYYDQKEVDLAGVNWSGCLEITAQELIDADLLKPFDDEKIDCINKNSKVRITKANQDSNEDMTAYIQCQEKSSKKTVYETKDIPTNSCTYGVPSTSKELADVVFDENRIGANCQKQSYGLINYLKGGCENNYVWYSGKLWRVISIDTKDNSIRMVTQWNMTTMPYTSGSTDYNNGYVKNWLNDARIDGFRGTLRERSKFLQVDNITLLSKAEVERAQNGGQNYLFNGLTSGLYDAYDSQKINSIHHSSVLDRFNPLENSMGVRPVITVKGNVKIQTGSGTKDNPYRFVGDTDKPSSGTLLNTRYSGEYVKFDDELYRIVYSDDDGRIKLTKVDFLPDRRRFDTKVSTEFSPTSTTNIGYYLNSEWIKTIDSKYRNLLTEGPWYIGEMDFSSDYIAIFCSDCVVDAKIGLPAVGEMLSGQFVSADVGKGYWTLTPYYKDQSMNIIYSHGIGSDSTPLTLSYYVRPSLYLKSDTKISSGQGTLKDPFILLV